ncbi:MULTISPECIES: N-acetylglucosamine kinase [Pseudothermotoga]|jgi:N-acetylglucosamine kinase-like BadF-type ATPase|uniref:N-acetylglucosamine kinase n=1 Tax=Pseudothermotoga TaxID=1643951 RepID=UPI00041B822E|nr:MULTISPECIES: BadF/BadG/BcrA/BcrD ATPase family protein [Pseudothermotoga]KUK21610.1 MAG: ATPase BadF/BadG/BcrA/BcrD type [Pseudothermotoga lettingae]MDI3495232.1 hypothetical protein [Pseudothermotoga sp.]MDK2885124.1 hypothetical protein [Pseudothermotoga sp.]HBJ82030.1 ATPase [Pseudothermotoga sp.]
MYFMGIDVGGSKTDVAIVDKNGKLISHVRASGANYQGVGVQKAYEILKSAINDALQKSSLNYNELSYSYFGVAGADMEYEIKIVKSILERLQLKNYDFDNDGRIALKSGTFDDKGILISCGTGGITYAGDGKKIARKGGFSRFFGERLGAFVIASMVASAIIRSKDQRDENTLMKQIFESKINQPIEEIMHYEYANEDKSKLAEYAILLIQSLYEAAHQFDYVALRIMGNIVDEIIKIVTAYRKEMYFTSPVKVVLEGSFFKKADPILINMIQSALSDEYILIIPKHPPVVGAVLLAAEKAGYKYDENFIANLLSHWGGKK